MVDWKRNLYVIWTAQFLSIMGFSFGLPFAPYYMQELGVTDPVDLKFWASLFASAAPLSLCVFSPIWGAVADRVGRKPMMLRAYIGGSIVLTLMGLVTRVEYLIVLRLLQGALTGTVTASLALVSTNTPSGRSGIALGAMSAAVYSGGMVGACLGGVTADLFGYRTAFFISGGLLIAAACLVFWGAKEVFQPPQRRPLLTTFRPAMSRLWIAAPLLALFVGVGFTRQFDTAMFPLLTQEINGKLEGAASWTGALSAMGGLAGLIAALTVGWLADRSRPERLGGWLALGAALCVFPQGLAYAFLPLFFERFGMILCAGGLDPVLNVWLAKTTPEKSRGFIFGWAASAKCLGWIFAPLVAGAIAAWIGVRAVYFVNCGLYLVFGAALVLVLKGRPSQS